MDKRTSQEIQQAAAAARLLDDPTLKAALDQVTANTFETWAKSDPTDNAGRERLFLFHRAQQSFVSVLSEAVQTGALAKQKVDRIKRQEEGGAVGRFLRRITR
jgi:hypothetical protein